MSVIADSYEKKDELFVETKAYAELKSIVEDSHWATLLGKPGDGKSTTATHLMLHYKRQGYQPLFVTSVRQWEMLISSTPREKQFVVIDDMFGAINLDERIAGEWLNEIEKMDKLVSEKKGDLLVVCTSRKYIFTDVKSKLHKCQRFSEVAIVDMTDNEYQLSGDEKVAILVKYANRYNVKLGAEILNQINGVQSPHGFPHCVEMFCTNTFYRKIGIKFFSNPEKAVQKEINNFKDNDPVKFLVLLLVRYHKNRFEKRQIKEMIVSSDADVQKLFSFLSIAQSTAYSSLMKAIKALTNTYLALTKDGYYTFTHESLAENVSKVYMEHNCVHATQILSFQEILKHVNTPQDSVKIPNHELAERITTELLTGSAELVSSCASWRDQTFVDEWIRFITMPCKASCSWSCLSKVLLKKILHIEDIDKNSLNYSYYARYQGRFQGRFVYDKQQLVTYLLGKDMHQAVSAILRNKTIQELLHNDPTWIKALEHALKRVCMTTRDMNIIKDIVKPLNVNKTIIDGSTALAYAIEAPDAECAQCIIENTKVLFEESNIKSFFEAIRKSSIDIAKFIQLFHNHAQSSEIKTKLLMCMLKYSSAKECLNMLSLLRDNGANFHRLNEDNFNALHIACERWKGYFDVLKYLLDIGVDASQVTSKGVVPLMLALENGQGVDNINLLLPISPKGHTDTTGQGYFHYLMCSYRGLDELITLCQMLLNEGEDIDLQDAKGRTPVMYFMHNFFLLLRQLKNNQIKKFFCSVPLNLHLTDDNGQNVLHYLFTMDVIAPRELGIKQRKYIYKLFQERFKVDDQLKNKNGVAPCMMAQKWAKVVSSYKYD